MNSARQKPKTRRRKEQPFVPDTNHQLSKSCSDNPPIVVSRQKTSERIGYGVERNTLGNSIGGKRPTAGLRHLQSEKANRISQCKIPPPTGRGRLMGNTTQPAILLRSPPYGQGALSTRLPHRASRRR